MFDRFEIAERAIDDDQPPYIIAELSANHNGDIVRAVDIMRAAKQAGADAVKLQTYTADTLTIECNRPDFRITDGLWAGRTLYELYQEASTPWAWHEQLFEKGQELGITVFSSPFDETAVDYLEELGAPAYKIASFEAVHIPLIAKAAKTKKPMIISTGMANIVEISEAVEAARRNGCEQLMLLHCISAYPTPNEEANLRTMVDMRTRFGVDVGLSDHTIGTTVAVSAVALGANLIEKHFTLRRSDGGPDSAFSLEPPELERLVTDCKTAWSALGSASYERRNSERDNVLFRRSIYVVRDIEPGEQFTSDNIRIIRPGYGMAPKLYEKVLGKPASRALTRGTPLDDNAVDGLT